MFVHVRLPIPECGWKFQSSFSAAEWHRALLSLSTMAAPSVDTPSVDAPSVDARLFPNIAVSFHNQQQLEFTSSAESTQLIEFAMACTIDRESSFPTQNTMRICRTDGFRLFGQTIQTPTVSDYSNSKLDGPFVVKTSEATTRAEATPSQPRPNSASKLTPQTPPLPPPPNAAALRCPRCASRKTKFCYYNNYNVNQPRHFCRACQRYWTAGGSMRNVPVGSGRRKGKQAALAEAAAEAAAESAAAATAVALAATAGDSAGASENQRLGVKSESGFHSEETEFKMRRTLSDGDSGMSRRRRLDDSPAESAAAVAASAITGEEGNNEVRREECSRRRPSCVVRGAGIPRSSSGPSVCPPVERRGSSSTPVSRTPLDIATLTRRLKRRALASAAVSSCTLDFATRGPDLNCQAENSSSSEPKHEGVPETYAAVAAAAPPLSSTFHLASSQVSSALVSAPSSLYSVLPSSSSYANLPVTALGPLSASAPPIQPRSPVTPSELVRTQLPDCSPATPTSSKLFNAPLLLEEPTGTIVQAKSFGHLCSPFRNLTGAQAAVVLARLMSSLQEPAAETCFLQEDNIATSRKVEAMVQPLPHASMDIDTTLVLSLGWMVCAIWLAL